MTDDNRRDNIADELARAAESTSAAETLLAADLHRDAISRACYACHHHLLALLLSRGLEPKTHAGGVSVFNAHFVRTGLFSSSFNRSLGGSSACANRPITTPRRCSPGMTHAAIDEATQFGDAVLAFLRGERWIA